MSDDTSGLKVIAIIEAAKGLLALLVGIGAHALTGENLQRGKYKTVVE